MFYLVINLTQFILDPRIKALTDSKYKEFREWFDQRLDDAIAAAEAQENGNTSKPAIDGIVTPNYHISEYILLNLLQLIQIL